MQGARQFARLFEPLEIRGVKVRNRIVCPPHSRCYATSDGEVTSETVATYAALAEGGVGMIIIESTAVDFPLGVSGGRRQRIDDDRYIPGLRRLTEAVHGRGCPLFLQLNHSGPSHKLKHIYGLPPVAASCLGGTDRPLPAADPDRAMTIPEIEQVIARFVRAAERARECGFDGVEVHCAQAYLLNSFLSPAWNQREDIYGGSVRNRARLPAEIISAIKQQVGQDFPVGIRINGQEMGCDKVITVGDSQEAATIFQEAGADYISVSAFGYGRYLWMTYPEQLLFPEPPEDAPNLRDRIRNEGLLVPAAAAVKKRVSIPVIAAGRLSPQLGERLLRDGKADLIGMVRSLLADPELPKKLASGRLEDIRPCVACVECTGKLANSEPVRCRVNAALGQEDKYSIKPAEKKKKVLVVGAGPAGLEAARVAALRGHEVTLYEKDRKIGGLMRLATLIKGAEIEDLPGLVRYYETQLDKLGVNVRLGEKVTRALVDVIKPDVVVVATGGRPGVPDIPGTDGRRAIEPSELYGRARFLLDLIGLRALERLTRVWLPVGRKVVIVGGLIAGCQLAEFLVKRGRQVTILEAGDEIATGIPERNKPRLVNWLTAKGVNMLTGVTWEQITSDGIRITTRNGEARTITADNVLIALPLEPDSALSDALRDRAAEIYKIGDCREPGKMIDAIDDGMRVGCQI